MMPPGMHPIPDPGAEMERLAEARKPKDLEDLPWRTGRTLGRTVYARTGGDDWKADTMLGVFDTPALAEAACKAHNEALESGGPS